MKPARLSSYLRKIAAAINESKSPRLSLVLEDLRLLLAVLERPMRYFTFPTDTNVAGTWNDPIFLEDMLDKVKDDYTLAQIYGNVIGIHQGEDFFWVIEIEADDEDLVEELMELGIANEIPKANVQFIENIDPIPIWWELFGKSIPGTEEAYPHTCLPGKLGEHDLPYGKTRGILN